jgi:2-aminoadipate transaminase
MEEMLVATAHPDVLSLALGLPCPDLFPTEALGRALGRTLDRDDRALQYGPPRDELRTFVAERMSGRGVSCGPDDVFLTAGAQQGMSLLTRLLLDPGDGVVVEEKCYPGFLQAVAPARPRLSTVPTDPRRGLDVDALERSLRGGLRPKLLYVIPDGHNPLGASLPRESRERIVELSGEFGFAVLEDDAYGGVRFRDDGPPVLRALDPEVLYVGSFSKTLAPALRCGWIVAPPRLAGPLGSLKESSDINTATLAQRAITDFVTRGHFDAHVSRLREGYGRRRAAMLASVDRHLPGATRSEPDAGFFVWVDLPDGADTVRLLRDCLDRERVAFVPGAAFAAGEAAPSRSGMRLSYSFASPQEIEEGVARIGRTWAASRKEPIRE